MDNFIRKQEKKLKKIIISCGYEIDDVNLVVSSRPDLGQYQFNGVMQLAKQKRENPRLIATKILEKLVKDTDYSNVNIAEPGFINISFSDQTLVNYMEEIRNNSINNMLNIKNKKIIIDYGGPNIAKTLHVGHLRSANIGESLKRLAKKFGCNVISDVHLGDWGRPMGLVILELKNKYPNWVYFDENYHGKYPDTCPITNKDLEKIYPIASLKAKEDEEYLEEARKITTKLQKKEKGYYELWKQIVAISSNEVKKMYDKLNVSFDLWKGESDADQYILKLINYLKKKDLVYQSQGALVMDVSLPEDIKPMPPLLIVKSNGSVSYETTDLATIWERMKIFKPEEIWYVVDKRQSLHFEQVFRAAYKSKIVPENVKLNFIGFGTMNGKDGKPFKTRDGGVMTLSALIDLVTKETLKNLNKDISGNERETIADEIAIAALKYADLLPNRAKDYIFDEEKFSDLNGKTGVYLLYSAIRIKSLLDKAKEQNIQIGSIECIDNNYDRNVILKILEIPAVLENAYEEKSLNDIAEYLYQLNNVFNTFYSFNKILIEKNPKIQQSWLGLSEIVYNVNVELLQILGIKIPRKI